jgi:hypothetical protein
MASEAAVESARREWRDGEQRLEAEARNGTRYGPLLEQVEIVVAELRRRVGQTFTLAELADAYADAERWSGEALDASEAPRWWPRTLTLVQAAAFARYARGAVDYRP